MKKTLILMSKIIFKKYLPPVRHKLVPKLKMHRIYWNLANVIFRISQSRFWRHRLFLLNIYHLFGPNWSQNLKYSEFIEIWPNWYFKYPGLDFNIRIIFIKHLPAVRSKLVPKLKVLIIYWNLAHSIFQICRSQF